MSHSFSSLGKWIKSSLGRTFRRLEGRIGKKQAALAIAHKILVIVYHLLATGSDYEEARYDHYHPQQEARERQRAIKALERLGYTVTVERAASPSGRRLLASASVIGWPCVPKQRQGRRGVVCLLGRNYFVGIRWNLAVPDRRSL